MTVTNSVAQWCYQKLFPNEQQSYSLTYYYIFTGLSLFIIVMYILF